MDEKLLAKLLRERKEKDWLEFKSKLKIYQSNGDVAERQRDEFIKDILGLANGNSHIIRKTKYLIFGADNNDFDENGTRVLHNVDYKTPSQSELMVWLNSACTPSIVGIECEIMLFQGINLLVITIPPTFEIHETTRELNASGHFNKHTVFMRQDEHTVPASVRDGVAIQQLKYLHRQEIANPSSLWIGAITGGIVAFIVGGAKIKATQTNLSDSGWFVQVILTVTGVIFGLLTGWFSKQWNETRYDLRYMTIRQRIILAIVILITIIALSFIFR